MIVPTLLLVGLLATPSVAGPDPVLLRQSGDEVLRSAFIPSERNVHGEFRLLRRGDATCAQTLLYTPSLRRALQRIRKKELRYWPEGRVTRTRSPYLYALDEATTLILGSAPADEAAQRLQTWPSSSSPRPIGTVRDLRVGDLHRTAGSRRGRWRPIVVREASPRYFLRRWSTADRGFCGNGDETTVTAVSRSDRRRGDLGRMVKLSHTVFALPFALSAAALAAAAHGWRWEWARLVWIVRGDVRGAHRGDGFTRLVDRSSTPEPQDAAASCRRAASPPAVWAFTAGLALLFIHAAHRARCAVVCPV